MTARYRVLVVDDSAFVRKTLRELLRQSAMFEVVGTAGDGVEAEALAERLLPDIITCDLTMPGMNGVEFVKRQMAKRPLPIVIMSSQATDGAEALAALEAGAVDFVRKPTALANERLHEATADLMQSLQAAAAAVPRASPRGDRAGTLASPRKRAVEVLVIGVSTGGPQALRQLLPRFAADFPVPISVVLHMPVGYTELFARKLDEVCALNVLEASEGEVLRPGVVLIAKAGRHLAFERVNGAVRAILRLAPFDTPHRPAVDVLFRSAAETYGAKILAVVMTGMGSDGKDGAAWIKAQGGTVLTQGPDSCVVYGMPRAVDEAGLSDASVELTALAEAIGERL